MTYARARLLVGTSGVGVVVVIAAAALLLGWPGVFLPTSAGPVAGDAAALAAVLLVHAAILAPFDILGGLVLPRRFGRSSVSAATFARAWSRGVAAQSLVVLAAGLGLLVAGRAGGFPAAALAFLAVTAVLVAGQGAIARIVAGLAVTAREGDVSFVRATDPGFTGGVVGVPGRERFVVPERWRDLLGAEGLAVQLRRWSATRGSGARGLGVAVAVGWNLAGFLVASLSPGAGFATVAGLVTVALGFTLWSFLGLLVLPSVSRPAVFAADRRARVAAEPDALVRALSVLDRQQDDEPERGATVETVFHPIPALSRRLAALARAAGPRIGAWHAARTALYLSWAGFGFLSRAVHCNSGRPELWALPPCD